MKTDEFLEWDFDPEVSITDRNFDITLKHWKIFIRCDIEGYDSSLSADCEIELLPFIEVCKKLIAEVESRSINQIIPDAGLINRAGDEQGGLYE